MAAALALTLAAPAPAEEVTGRFLLETHDGRRVTDSSFAGKVRMMAFGYTYCPDICPTTLATMAAALDLLSADEAAQVVPIFATVDPKRDTVAHLKDYMAAFGPAFVGLTGTPQMTDAAARAFKVRYQIHPPPGEARDSYLVDHSAGIYLMRRDGSFAARLGHMAGPDEVAARLRQVLAQ
ncbi:Electron transport protein SCO1/SenC [Magnetospirillum sp. UT-4]|nr:Electron transport protein SCO1/SenC [Magnetospirillum sp. UT-4]